MEELILEEVAQFTTFLKGRQFMQGPVDMACQFNLPILNALWRITVGDKLEYTDPMQGASNSENSSTNTV